MVSVVDYGVANLASLLNMLRKADVSASGITTPEEILKAEKLILPGVGAFDNGMGHLRERRLAEPIIEAIRERGTPVLGICLGMQLLGKGSEEGSLSGLGLIDATCVRFRLARESGLKVPHQGWGRPKLHHTSPLLRVVDRRTRFYFTHSFHLVCEEPTDVLATARYGIDFTAMIERDNIRGVQFHPEKSHRYGMALLKAYAGL